jgi:hypothetical protein
MSLRPIVGKPKHPALLEHHRERALHVENRLADRITARSRPPHRDWCWTSRRSTNGWDWLLFPDRMTTRRQASTSRTPAVGSSASPAMSAAPGTAISSPHRPGADKHAWLADTFTAQVQESVTGTGCRHELICELSPLSPRSAGEIRAGSWHGVRVVSILDNR